jgi:hypothetical protein
MDKSTENLPEGTPLFYRSSISLCINQTIFGVPILLELRTGKGW